MSGPVHLRFVGVTLLQILLWPHLLSAQLPERVERCLPYPTLAQEIRAMMEETEPKQEQPPEIKITSVKFGRETRLSQAIRTRIVLAITRHQFYDDSKFDWLDELKEMPVKGALQDLGYFRAKV